MKKNDEPPASTFFAEGDLLAGYRLLGARSRGAMGIVYEAVAMDSGRRVAVKVLRARASKHADTLIRERDALAALVHPAIVSYVDHGHTASGLPYLVTEWLEGEDLETRLRRGRLSIEETLAIGLAIARALGAAHAHGIVHRDVKPANIHLGADGAIKLLDFGVALSIGERSGALAVGTALYMAPEQIRAAASVDARADVYALGSVIFECLAGRPPFAGERTTLVLARTIFEPAPRLSRISGGDVLVPAALDALVARMLEKRPADRPAHGAEIAALLEACPTTPARASSVDDRERESEEQRISCVGLVALPEAPAEAGTVVDGAATGLVARLGALAEELGVAVDGLGADTFLVTASDDVPSDQATRIGRFAIELVTTERRARVALATGTLASTGSSAIERAEELLARTGAGLARVCPATRSLLEGRIASRGDELISAGPSLVPAAGQVFGRDALIHEILARRAVLVTGDAGTGKTCILHEIVARLAGRRVISIRGELHRTTSPMAPFIDWLRRRADEGSIAHRDVLARVIGDGVAALAPSPSDVARAIVELLVDGASDVPATIVVDDGQWLDPASLRVIEIALGRAAAGDVRIIVLARADGHARMSMLPDTIAIPSLDRAAARALVVAAAPSLEEPVVDRIVARALGHAFVLRELARAASEGAGDDETVPDNVIGIVQARLARLPDDVRRVARVIAVVGTRIESRDARHLAGEGSEAALDALVRSEVGVREADGSFTFASPLLRDAAYELLTGAEREAVHAEAARWLDDDPDHDPAIVAWHAERGRDLDRAARAYAAASRRAFQVGALSLAVDHARRGIACGPTGETLGALWLAESEAWLASNDEIGAAEVRATSARALFRPGSAAWMSTLMMRARIAGRLVDIPTLLATLEDVASVAAIDRAAEGRAFVAACIATYWLCNLGERVESERAYAAVERRSRALELEDTELAWWLILRAIRAQHRGEWSAVIEAHTRSGEMYARASHQVGLIASRMNIGSAHGEAGELDIAVAQLADVIRDASALGIGPAVSFCRLCRGRALRRLGRLEEAEEEMTLALDGAADDLRLRIHTQSELARIAIGNGDLDEARERADLAIELAPTMPLALANATAARAEVHLREGELDLARALSSRAMAITRAHLPSSDDASYVAYVHVEILAVGGFASDEARAELDAIHAELLERASCVGPEPMQRAYLAIPDNARILERAQCLSSRSVQ